MTIDENVKEYAHLQFKKMKFELVEFFAKERSEAIHSAMIGVVLLLLTIMGSFFFSFFINDKLESEFLGFGIVFLFWIILFITLIVFKKAIKRTLFENYVNQNIPK